MVHIIEGQIIDTYGGDYTYRDVWYEVEKDEYFFYEMIYGPKPPETELITDENEIKELMTLI